MKVQKYGKCHVAFGATWTTLPGADTQAKEIKKAAKEAQANYYVSIAREGSRPLFGLLKNTVGRAPNYSAAALIPVLVPRVRNAIFSFHFEDGSAAIICFVGGLPMVGFDVVGQPEAVEIRLHDFLSLMEDDPEQVVLYGDFSAFSAHFSDVQSFDYLSQKIDQTEAAHAVFRRAMLPGGVWLGLGVFVFLSVAGYYAYDWHQQDLLRQTKLKLIEPNIAYDTNVRRMLGAAGVPAKSALLTMLPTIGEVPVFLGGWKLSSAICQVESCSVSWVSDSRIPSTFNGFKSSLPADWSATYKSDFQTIDTVIKIKAEAKLGVDLNQLQRSDDFVILMGTEVQRLKAIGADLQFTKPALFGVPALPADQPAITINVLKNPILEGTWSLAGPWWLLEYVQSMAPSITLTSLALSNSVKEIIFKVEGKYYVSK